MTPSPLPALEACVRLGVERILTSGQEDTCLEGLETLRLVVEHAKGRVIVVPGGGITKKNLKKIIEGSGAKEFHVSGRTQ